MPTFTGGAWIRLHVIAAFFCSLVGEHEAGAVDGRFIIVWSRNSGEVFGLSTTCSGRNESSMPVVIAIIDFSSSLPSDRSLPKPDMFLKYVLLKNNVKNWFYYVW